MLVPLPLLLPLLMPLLQQQHALLLLSPLTCVTQRAPRQPFHSAVHAKVDHSICTVHLRGRHSRAAIQH
jgi:hypothetical protein